MSKGKTKKWKAYFLEFLLLFLAVSLGFMADNFREKRSDRTKEKEYMQSMIEDVAADRINIKEVIDRNSQRISYLDSLLDKCSNYSATDKEKLDLNKYFSQVLRHPEFIAPAELTMQQLKNAGGMRLIKSKAAINEIIRYDSKLQKIAGQQLYYENYQNKAIDSGTKIFNIHQLVLALINPDKEFTSAEFELFTEDKLKLKEFANSVAMYKGIIMYYVVLLKAMDKQGEVLTQTLEREYKL